MRFASTPTLAILLFLAAFGDCARGELIQTINIRLVAHVTTSTTTNGTTRIEKMKTVRIATREVLRMLGQATTNDFKGATLVSVHRGEAYQVRRGTNILADVSGFFTEVASSEDVIDQTFDSTSGKDSYHGFWLRTMEFNDNHGNRFTLSGMIEERYTAPVADNTGMQNVSDNELLTGRGSGTLNSDFGGISAEGDFALFTGTILMSGKGVVPLNTF